MTRLRLALLLTGLLWGGLAWGSGESARNPLVRVLEENPLILAAEAELRSVRQAFPLARANLLPQVALDVASTHTVYDIPGPGGGQEHTDPASAVLSVSQSLYNRESLTTRQMAAPQVAAAEQNLAHQQQGVLLNALEVMVTLLQTRQVAELARNNLLLTRKHLEATQARFEVGVITRTDLSQAQARVAAAEAERIQAENQVSLTEARYQEVVGEWPPAALRLPVLPPAVAALVGDDDPARMQAMLESRPDLLAAMYQLQVSNLNVNLKQAGHHPTLAVSSTAGRSWNSTVGYQDPVDSVAVGFSLDIPIYTGGRVQAQTRQARHQRDQTQAHLDQLKRQARRELEQALRDHRSAQASVHAFSSAVDAAMAALNGMEEEFRVGTRTALDLLDAQYELFANQTELTKSRFTVQLGRFRILQSLGLLNLANLGIQ